MTHKEIADRLRGLIDGTSNGIVLSEAIQRIADELDPSHPEPGTVVWWKGAFFGASKEWQLGEADRDGVVQFGREQSTSWEDIEYKPARIAGPMQEIADIPPAKVWPRKCDEVELRWHYDDPNFISEYAGATITRGEAARREAEG